LCNHNEAIIVQPDYDVAIEEILRRQVFAHLRVWKNLDILCVCNEAIRIERRQEKYWLPNGVCVDPDPREWAQVLPLPSLPTWIPNWTSPRTMWHLGPQSWSAKSEWKAVFDAASGSLPRVDNLSDAARGNVLKLVGFHIDTVATCEKFTPPPSTDQGNPCSYFYLYCLQLCQRKPLSETPFGSEGERLDSFWRTITLGGQQTGANHTFSMEYIRYFCLQFFSEPQSEVGKWLRQHGYHVPSPPPKHKWFDKEVEPQYYADNSPTITFARFCYFKFFVTHSGRMAMGPAHTTSGDIIVVLHGCSSPLVLYQSSHNPGTYCIRGEAYIDGFMYGEALELCRQGRLNEQVFALS
jgi:hypothetical protein